LQYSARIWSFENRRSISTASSASLIFRERLFWGVRNTARASCWVSVDAPSA
jgi:hypothetical protein